MWVKSLFWTPALPYKSAFTTAVLFDVCPVIVSVAANSPSTLDNITVPVVAVPADPKDVNPLESILLPAESCKLKLFASTTLT